MTDSMVERVAEAIFLQEGRAKDVAWADANKVLLMRSSRCHRGYAGAD